MHIFMHVSIYVWVCFAFFVVVVVVVQNAVVCVNADGQCHIFIMSETVSEMFDVDTHVHVHTHTHTHSRQPPRPTTVAPLSIDPVY